MLQPYISSRNEIRAMIRVHAIKGGLRYQCLFFRSKQRTVKSSRFIRDIIKSVASSSNTISLYFCFFRGSGLHALASPLEAAADGSIAAKVGTFVPLAASRSFANRLLFDLSVEAARLRRTHLSHRRNAPLFCCCFSTDSINWLCGECRTIEALSLPDRTPPIGHREDIGVLRTLFHRDGIRLFVKVSIHNTERQRSLAFTSSETHS